MILAIQSLFSIGNIFVFDDQQQVIAQFSWQKSNGHPNLIREIASLLEAQNISSQEITEITAVQGPGPFTAVRTIAVIARTWKSAVPNLRIKAIPSGLFLRSKFPAAEELILPAGKTAFFRFDQQNPEQFEKYPLSRFGELFGNIGGFYDLSWPPELIDRFLEGRADAEVFQNCLRREDVLESPFLPIYGAEANINFEKKA